MKLILITLVTVVVGMMVGCSSEPHAPTAVPPPAYSDAEVIGAVKAHLTAVGMSSGCQNYGKGYLAKQASVSRDPTNPDKYFVTAGNGGSWTFIASLVKVISTSTEPFGVDGC